MSRDADQQTILTAVIKAQEALSKELEDHRTPAPERNAKTVDRLFTILDSRKLVRAVERERERVDGELAGSTSAAA